MKYSSHLRHPGTLTVHPALMAADTLCHDPIRRVLLGSAAVSCLIASALAVTQLIEVSQRLSSCTALLRCKSSK